MSCPTLRKHRSSRFQTYRIYFAGGEAERGPRLLQMLAGFVNGRAFPVLFGAARPDRAFNLVTDDSPNAISDRFILPQLVAHDSRSRHAEGERDVAVFRFAGDIAANPIRRLESRAAS